MSDFEQKVSELTEVEIKVLCVLHMLSGSSFGFGYGNCYYSHNAILCGEGQLTNLEKEVGGRKGLSKVLKELRAFDLVQYQRGLMTEDGEVAGSGHAPNVIYQEEIEKVCEQRGWL